MQDYLDAYKSTGRLPQPCPQSPDTPTARAALGLPPLFVPAAIPVPSDAINNTANPSDAPLTLPPHHDFRSTHTVLGEHFESIAAQTLYSHFSHEVRLARAWPRVC